MAEVKTMRLSKVLREFNISLDRAVDFLQSKGYEIEARPTTKITAEEYEVLFDEFQTDKSKKVASKEVGEEKRKEKEELRLAREKELEEKAPEPEVIKAEAKLEGPKQVGTIDLEPKKEEKAEPVKEEPKAAEVEEKKEEPAPVAKPKVEAKKEPVKEAPAKKEAAKEEPKEPEKVKTQYKKLDGPNFTGEKIDLSKFKKPERKTKKDDDSKTEKRSRRRRISKAPTDRSGGAQGRGRRGRLKTPKEEPSEEEVQKQVRETLEKLQGKSSKGKGAKYRREKRDVHRKKSEEELAQMEAESKLLKVTEFVTVSEVATMMNVPVTQVISACMSLGMMVTMNQRLDAETLSIVAEEFGYEVEFVTADIEESIQE